VALFDGNPLAEAPLGRRRLAEQGIELRARSMAEPVSPRPAGPFAPVRSAAAPGQGQHERVAPSGEGQNLLDALVRSDATRMLALFCVVLLGLPVL
jgi:hypothetical protein